MICINPYCHGISFCAVSEPDNHRVIGLKCLNCGARYTLDDIQIKEKLELDRKQAWNSVLWKVGFRK